MVKARIVLPRLLVERGLADVQTLGMATGIAAEGDVSMVHALIRWRFVSAQELCDALATATGMGVTTPIPDRKVAGLVKKALCVRLRVLPLWQRGGVLGLAMSDPTDDPSANLIHKHTGLPVERFLVNDEALDVAIRRAYSEGEPNSEDDWEALQTLPIVPKSATPNKVVRAPEPVSMLEPVPRSSSQSLPVVLGEPSQMDMQLPLLPVMKNDPLTESSGVFTNQTIDMPMEAYRPRTKATPTPNIATDEAMRDSEARVSALPLEVDEKTTVGADIPPSSGADDEMTVPSSDLLRFMRVLVVVGDEYRPAFEAVLRPRLPKLTVSVMPSAGAVLDKARFDEVVVIAHGASDLAGLASIAVRTKRGVTVFCDSTISQAASQIAGVREVSTLNRTDDETAQATLTHLQTRAVA